MSTLHGTLHIALVFTMLSLVISRSFCQVIAEVNRKSCPAFGSFFRTFTTSDHKCGEESDNGSVVTYSELKAMLSARNIQLFDVRNPDEYKAGRIADAVNLPLDSLEGILKLSPEEFKQKFEVKAPGKNDDNIVFHCRTGKRSAKALEIAHQLGFGRARHYEGGYCEWAEKQGK